MGVTGHKQIERDFRDYAKGVEKGLKKKFLKWVNKLANDAKVHCPVETGAGRTTIHGVVETSGETLTGVYGTNAKHLVFVEFGTNRIQVGTPTDPRRTWAAKAASVPKVTSRAGTKRRARQETLLAAFAAAEMGGRGETMPFMRVAWAENKKALGKDLKNIGKEIKLKGKTI